MRSFHPHRLRTFLVLLIFVGACDCEDRVRRMLSNNSAESRVRPIDAGATTSRPGETEPNDAATRATPIELAGELRPVDAEIATPSDVDWYALSVPRDAPWDVELHLEPSRDLDLSVHVQPVLDQEALPSSYNLAAAGEDESVPILRVGAEPLHVVVRSEKNTSGRYTIRFKRRLSGGAIEAEPNDDPETAISLTMPGEIQGYYDRPDDRDVFKLTGVPNAVHILEVTPVPNVRQIVRLFAAEAPPEGAAGAQTRPNFNEPLLSFQVTQNAPARIPNIALPSNGDVWLVLTTTSGYNRQQGYRVRLQPHPPTEADLEIEPNDRVPQKLGLEAKLFGYIDRSDDVDRFRLEAPEYQPEAEAAEQAREETREEAPVPSPPERDTPIEEEEADALAAFRDKEPSLRPMWIILEPAHEVLELGLQWIDAEGTRAFEPSAPGETVEICGFDLGKAWAEIEVRPRQLDESAAREGFDYALEVKEMASAAEFEVEPNDRRTDADILQATRRGQLNTGTDTDFYVFEIAGEALDPARSITLTLSAKQSDYAFRVLDEEGGLVAEVDNRGSGGGEQLKVDLPAGVYFVEVRTKSGASCEVYSLALERS